MSAASRFVASVDGTQLHVLESGDPRARHGVVFVHGFALSSLVFDAQLAAAPMPGWKRVAFDLRGHGRSQEGPGDYLDPRVWADDLRTVIAASGLDEVVLVAWSYGGLVVGDFFSQGGRADGLVLVAVGGNATPVADEASDDEFISLLPALRSDELDTAHAATRRLVSMLTYRPLADDWAMILEGAAARSGLGVRSALTRRTRDVRGWLTGSGLPTLIIQGDRDELLPLEASRELAAASGAELILMVDAGHMPFFEHPDSFNAALVRFLRTHFSHQPADRYTNERNSA